MKNTDPYEAQGKDFRVNHPTQPKTQVERWREEYEANDKAIFDCCGYVFNAESGTFEVKNDGCDCPKQGTDRCGKRHNKNKEIGVLVLADHEKNKTYLNRHTVGTFADNNNEKD